MIKKIKTFVIQSFLFRILQFYFKRNSIPLFNYSDFRGYEIGFIDESEYPNLNYLKINNYLFLLLNRYWEGLKKIKESILFAQARKIHHSAILVDQYFRKDNNNQKKWYLSLSGDFRECFVENINSKTIIDSFKVEEKHKNTYIDISFGLLESYLKYAKGKVTFFINIVFDDTKKNVIKWNLDPSCPKNYRDRYWQEHFIDLKPWVGKNIKIELRTTASLRKNFFNHSDSRAIAWNYSKISKTNKTNRKIFVFCLDGLRPDYIGPYNSEISYTPNLNLLSKDSIVLKNAYSQASQTKGSIRSILTGKYPSKSNLYKMSIEPETEMVQGIFKKNNYKTFGTSSAAQFAPHKGFGKGFDSVFYKQYLDQKNNLNGQQAILKLIEFTHRYKNENIFTFHDLSETHYPFSCIFNFNSNKTVTGTITNQLEENLFRGPYKLNREEYIERYIQSIAYMDHLLGTFFNYLKIEGLWESSLIILTSDHGNTFDPRDYSINRNLYKDQLHVPLIMKLPLWSEINNVRLDIDINKLISNGISLLPTIMDISGIKSTSYDFDGESIFKMNTKLDLVLKSYIENKLYPYNISDGYIGKGYPHGLNIRSENYSLIIDVNHKDKNIINERIEFYDLKNDPEEKINLHKQIDHINEKHIIAFNHLKKILLDHINDTNFLNISSDISISVDNIESRKMKETWKNLGYIT